MRARHPPVPQHPTLAQQQADFTNEGAPPPEAVVPAVPAVPAVPVVGARQPGLRAVPRPGASRPGSRRGWPNGRPPGAER